MSASPSSSDASDSSSVVYDHEPFATFCSRVRDLAVGLWPNSNANDFRIERLGGGAFHRVIGLTQRQPGVEEARYILRIPRFDSARVDDEIAALYYLSRTTIPVPAVIAFDKTGDNALGLPYMVQTRIAGADLYSCFPALGHAQRMRTAHELGGVFSQMLETRSSIGGRFVLDGENGAVRIRPLSTPTEDDDNMAPEESPCEWLLAQFSAKQADDPTETLWSEFGQMTRDLDAGGWLNFRGLQYSLAHLDLAPRNILVDTTCLSDPSQNLITGILD